jgi:hypothetical protein
MVVRALLVNQIFWHSRQDHAINMARSAKMKKYVIAGALLMSAVAMGGAAASAYENFIPLGTGYSSDVDSLADVGTDRNDLTVRSDVYETELYRAGRNAAEADSFFRRFQSDTELEGGDTSIDY